MTLKLQINDPLRDIESPLSEETTELLEQIGFIIGVMLDQKVDSSAKAVLLLNHMAIQGHAQGVLKAGFVANGLSVGMLEAAKIDMDFEGRTASAKKGRQGTPRKPNKPQSRT